MATQRSEYDKRYNDVRKKTMGRTTAQYLDGDDYKIYLEMSTLYGSQKKALVCAMRLLKKYADKKRGG